ncbi:MAG: PrsW family intramembrane metalloprotease [Erysipelotrichaceae bacterium]|nr:PrsW family intramembrane metalloprotease [Erysipelotrichaceae bacterium]
MTTIIVFLAVLPSLVLLFYIYKRDSINKEPKSLLLKLFVLGCLSVIPIIIAEFFVVDLMDIYIFDNTLYNLVDAFVCAALVEESIKFIVTKLTIWKNKAFDSTFDGMVYCAFVSMGFATVENIIYCLFFGLPTVFSRMFTSIPGHFSFAIVMGFFISKAKYEETKGKKQEINTNKSRKLLACSLIIPVIQHGFYDFCLVQDSRVLFFVFILVVVFSYLIILIIVHREHKRDTLFYEDDRLL